MGCARSVTRTGLDRFGGVYHYSMTIVRYRSAILSIACFAFAACSGSTGTREPRPDRVDNVGSFNGARIDVLAEGGFAALSIHHAVTHDDRKFIYANRHLCAQNCGAPLDSASGTLTPAAADSLFNIILAQDPFTLKDDYGTTRGGADMFAYTVRVTAEGRSKTIKFDDGTTPERMHPILQAVQGIIAAARR